jgi:hypothetical protein
MQLTGAQALIKSLEQAGVEVLLVPRKDGRIDLDLALRRWRRVV